MIQLIILGGSGRMGQAISRLADDILDVTIACQLGSAETPESTDLESCLSDDIQTVLIDFSLPGVIEPWLPFLCQHRIPIVSGVTGMDSSQQQALHSAAASIPVLWGSNMSVGIQLLQSALQQIAQWNAADTPVELLDVHHTAKRDAPSGTAVSLVRTWLEATGTETDRVQTMIESMALEQVGAGQVGHCGPVDIEVRREGDVVGEHSIRIDMGEERLTLKHSALDRDVFARGAIRAALWLVNRESGYYLFADLFRVE